MGPIRELVTKYIFVADDKALNRFMGKVDRAKGKVDRLASRGSAHGGGLVSRLFGGPRGAANLDASMTRMQNSMNSLTSTAFRMGLAFTAGGFGVGMFFKQISDFEQNEVAFETMLGSAEVAKKAISDLQDFARKTPFNFTQLTELSKRLLAFSFTAEELIPTMSDLGNIASGVGRQKLPQLILALGQVRTAGTLRGQELRQFTEAGVPLLEELAKTTGRVKEEIQDMVQRGEISYDMVRESIANMSKEGGRFHNLMLRQSKTLGGLFSNTIDYLQILLIKVGKRGLLKEAKAFITGLIDILERNEEEILARTDQIIRSIIKGMAHVINIFKAAGHVFRGFASIVGGTENAVNLLIGALAFMTGVRMLGMLGNFTIGLWGAVRALLALQGTAFLIPVAIGAAMAAVGLIAEDILAYFQGRKSITGLLMENFDKVATHIAGKADEIAEKLRGKSKALAQSMLAFMEDNGPAIGKMISDWMEFGLILTGAAFRIGYAIAEGFIAGAWEKLTGGGGDGGPGGESEGGGLWDKIKGAASFLGDNHPLGMMLKNTTGKAWGSLVEGAQSGDLALGMSPLQFQPGSTSGRGGLKIGQVTNNISVPAGMTADQARQIVAEGTADGITKAEMRRAQGSLQTAVAN